MTAPDPGLTDLITAHEWVHFAPRRYSKCLCGWQGDEPDHPRVGHPAHVALVVEQHTNGRIAELEAEVEQWRGMYRVNLDYCIEYESRMKNAESTVARVEAYQEDLRCHGGFPAQARRLRAALEGEQQ